MSDSSSSPRLSIDDYDEDDRRQEFVNRLGGGSSFNNKQSNAFLFTRHDDSNDVGSSQQATRKRSNKANNLEPPSKISKNEQKKQGKMADKAEIDRISGIVAKTKSNYFGSFFKIIFI
jgi:hypothetical protein